MTIPSFQEFMLPLLQYVADGKQYINRIAIDATADILGITTKEKEYLLPSKTALVYLNRGQWAISDLRRAGLLYSEKRGLIQITSLGLHILQDKPEKITRQFLQQLEPTLNVSYNQINEEDKENIIKNTPFEAIEYSVQSITEVLQSTLIERILQNSPEFFEKLVAHLICTMGYGGSIQNILQDCGKSGDGGIDGIIKQDALGLDQIHLQAKRYQANHTVSSRDLRDFCGALYNKKNPKGIFITTSSYTKNATQYAKENNLIIIDGKNLVELMIQYNVGVQVQKTIELKMLDENFFLEE